MGAINYYTYILLKPGASAARLQGKLGLILTKYFVPEARKDGDPDPDRITRNGRLLLQPISAVHLDAGIDDGLPHGDPRFVWLFGAIAGFILIIACINFVNLATARSANRAKEVGLRKVVGCLKSDLIRQFLTESLGISFLSFLLGILLAWILTPYFNLLTAKSLVFPWREWWLLPVTFGAALVTGVLAGLYPAFYLSAFRPIKVLKGNLSRGSKNSLLRNGLVVFQFTTSIALIIGTLVIEDQMQFILHRKIGFNKDQVVLLQGLNTMDGRQLTSFKSELLRIPQVVKVSVSDFLPVSGTPRNQNSFFKVGAGPLKNEVDGQYWLVDADYIPTLGMKLVERRNFSPAIPSDSQAVIINQTMAAHLHLKNPIGARITNDPHESKSAIFNVIGVVQDFNFESMRSQIDPLCFHLGQGSSTLSVRIGAQDMRAALGSITAIWKQFVPNQPIRYTFLDQRFAEMYDDVTRTGRIFSSFAVLAIIVACLGLFALSAFMAEQRLREIGIRKVLGATVAGITSMLSGDFLKLVLVSIILASPVAWIFMNRWLRDFAYRIHISWWMFGLSGLIALVIAIGTISFQSIRAALVNPAGLLRSV